MHSLVVAAAIMLQIVVANRSANPKPDKSVSEMCTYNSYQNDDKGLEPLCMEGQAKTTAC